MVAYDGKSEETAPWSELFAEHSTPQSFWQAVLRVAARTTGAEGVFLYLRRDSATQREWQRILQYPSRPAHSLTPEVVERICQEALETGSAQGAPSDFQGVGHAALRLEAQAGEPPAVLVVVSSARSSAEVASWVERLLPLSGVPSVFRTQSRARRAEADIRRIAAVLDLVILLNRETRFMAAAMRVCNEIAGRHGYARVSLGWVENEEVRVKALSHTEKFEQKMELVRRLEGAMEECLDQDEEIVWPADKGQVTVTREHEAYATQADSQLILTVPLRVGGRAIGALVVERSGVTLPEPGELDQLRLYGDQLGRRLEDLRQQDRWWGARAWAGVRERAAGLMGPRHTGWKLTGLGVSLALLVLIFWHTTYRVEAAFTIRGESAVYITAPFDGYLAELHAEIGDTVSPDQLLAAFDTRELRLQETDTRAEMARYQREAEKARAEQEFASMRINLARVEELRAQLAIIEQRLAQAEVRAPITGAVIEGDLRELLGAPFTKGDMLFRVAGGQGLFIEARIDERDVDDVAAGRPVEISFTSRPDLVFPAELVRIDPMAEVGEEGNVFRVRCDPAGELPEWWRPGMTGVAKIDGGRHSLLWILSHRTVDFLRMYLWW